MQDDEWLQIRPAARRLGVTPTAIRNRIKRGTLETKPDGNRGRLVRVPATVTVTGDRPERERVTVTGDRPLTETVTLLNQHIRRLETALAELTVKAAAHDAIAVQLAALESVLAERQAIIDRLLTARAPVPSIPAAPPSLLARLADLFRRTG